VSLDSRELLSTVFVSTCLHMLNSAISSCNYLDNSYSSTVRFFLSCIMRILGINAFERVPVWRGPASHPWHLTTPGACQCKRSPACCTLWAAGGQGMECVLSWLARHASPPWAPLCWHSAEPWSAIAEQSVSENTPAAILLQAPAVRRSDHCSQEKARRACLRVPDRRDSENMCWPSQDMHAKLLCQALHADLVLSGSEDGTVREVDVRVRPPPLNRTQELQPASEDYNVLGAWHSFLEGGALALPSALFVWSMLSVLLPVPVGGLLWRGLPRCRLTENGSQHYPAPLFPACEQWTSGRSA
jgi:hypothetical protein